MTLPQVLNSWVVISTEYTESGSFARMMVWLIGYRVPARQHHHIIQIVRTLDITSGLRGKRSRLLSLAKLPVSVKEEERYVI